MIRHYTALALIWAGFRLLDKEVREEVFRLLGLAGRKDIL